MCATELRARFVGRRQRERDDRIYHQPPDGVAEGPLAAAGLPISWSPYVRRPRCGRGPPRGLGGFIGGAEVFRERFGPAAVLVIVPVQAVVAVSPFPSEILALGTSALYGFWGGALLAWCAWFLAAFLQYFVVQRTARDFDFDRVRRRLPRWLRELPVSHPAFLILGRWFPYGAHIVNSAAGAYGVALTRHAWCAGVSIVPPALLISAVANGLLRF